MLFSKISYKALLKCPKNKNAIIIPYRSFDTFSNFKENSIKVFNAGVHYGSFLTFSLAFLSIFGGLVYEFTSLQNQIQMNEKDIITAKENIKAAKETYEKDIIAAKEIHEKDIIAVKEVYEKDFKTAVALAEKNALETVTKYAYGSEFAEMRRNQERRKVMSRLNNKKVKIKQ